MIPPRVDEGKSTLGYSTASPGKRGSTARRASLHKLPPLPFVGNKLNTGLYTKSNTIIIKFVGKINNQPRKK